MILCIDGSDIRLLALAAFVHGADGAWYENAREEAAVGPESFLASITHFVPLEEIEGIVIVQGPGSATALRASLAIANTLAMTNGIPLCGVEKGAAWESALARDGLRTPVDHLEPVYAANASITPSTKDHLRRSIEVMSERFGQYGKHRMLEAIPGLLVWGTFVAAVLASFFAPITAIVFIIIFDLYWLLRVLYFVINLLAGYQTYRATMAVDWYARLQALPNWMRLYHVVMLPTYQEDIAIIRDALRGIMESPYRKDRMIVMVGGEEGDAENFRKCRTALEREFAGVFAELLFTVHAKGLPGEIPGKGSNLHSMALEAKRIIDGRGLPYADVIVSAFDIDTVPHVQYFPRLAYLFLTVPNPLRTSYQPVTLFSNNIWNATAPVRIASFGTTFWLLSELVRPERLWTFSSHSMPWQMLVDVGYWEPDLVSEDSRIFLQGLIHYEGDYRVTPMFLPVSMDTVTGATYLESLKALYLQQRRWAWGVEHFAYMIEKFRSHPKIPMRTKIKYVFNHMEGMYTWATAPVLIFVLGYLPFFTVGQAENALIANSPFTLEWIMRIATLGVFVTGAMSFFFLPPRPGHRGRHTWIVHLAQWALLPITSILFSALPAIDAQTRFIFGRYLGFNVTKKHVSSRR